MDVSSTRTPVKVVPRMPSCTKGWPNESSPRAQSVAITAHVPVPHGELSAGRANPHHLKEERRIVNGRMKRKVTWLRCVEHVQE